MVRPNCSCGKPCERGYNTVGGVKKEYWRTKCQSCRGAKRYRLFKQDSCAECGFVALDKCQLDVDHIDGDHSNNSPDNLQTLCANCHRLKTIKNKDYLSKA